jgi:hypothetical protein
VGSDIVLFHFSVVFLSDWNEGKKINDTVHTKERGLDFQSETGRCIIMFNSTSAMVNVFGTMSESVIMVCYHEKKKKKKSSVGVGVVKGIY